MQNQKDEQKVCRTTVTAVLCYFSVLSSLSHEISNPPLSASSITHMYTNAAMSYRMTVPLPADEGISIVSVTFVFFCSLFSFFLLSWLSLFPLSSCVLVFILSVSFFFLRLLLCCNPQYADCSAYYNHDYSFS